MSSVENAVAGAVAKEASAKFNCKDIDFKKPRTWGWVIGIAVSVLLLVSGFTVLFTCAGAGIFAIIFGAAMFFIEFFCCFKCCVKCKDCVTKAEPFLTNPFMKGSAYCVIGVVGIIISVAACADAIPFFPLILYACAVAAGIAYLIFGFTEKGCGKGNSGSSASVSELTPSL